MTLGDQRVFAALTPPRLSSKCYSVHTLTSLALRVLTFSLLVSL